MFSACPSVSGHSNSVIFNRISSKLHICISSTNLSFKFEYGFCPTSDNQDGQQNGRYLSISAVVLSLTQSFLIGFLPNFIYELLSSSFHSSSNMGFVRHTVIKMDDKMAAPINVCFCGHFILLIVIFIGFLSNLYMDCFCQTLI